MIRESEIRAIFDAETMRAVKSSPKQNMCLLSWPMSTKDLEVDVNAKAGGAMVIKPMLVVAPPISSGLQQTKQDLRGIYQIIISARPGVRMTDVTDMADHLCSSFNLAMFAEGIYVSIHERELVLISPAEKSPTFSGSDGASVTVSLHYRINNVELY